MFFDTAYGDEISLLESASEFVQRKKQSPETLPMICSSCPGWICYAEKTRPELLPLISTTKSPQQVMGTIVKGYFASVASISPKQIYHVTVMPCYDRKLEASRNDFRLPDINAPEVDMVLATSEVVQLIHDQKIDFVSLSGAPLNTLPLVNLTMNGTLSGIRGGTSGGYLEYIYKHAAKELFNREVTNIEYIRGRNPDFMEVIISGDSGEPLLKFARAYGFRNIQNIVKKLKEKKGGYDFIEIMACPGGCTSGGAQVGGGLTKSESKMNSQQVNQIYDSTTSVNPGWHPKVRAVYDQLCSNPKTRKETLHTTYHSVPKLELTRPLSIKW